jgi:acyl-coenzyme A thioesterase PaaI-like protein
MSTLLELVQEARANRAFALLAEAVPYAKTFGISVDDSRGELIGKLTYAPELIGNPVLPALHGGTIGALLESTAIFQTLWETDTLSFPKIVTITVDFLRSGKPVDTYARAWIAKPGRRVVNVGVEAWQDDRRRPIAKANAHFLIQPIAQSDT